MGEPEHQIELQNVSLQVPCFVQDGEWTGTWTSSIAGALFTRPRRVIRTILSDISFKLVDGDRLALLGRNGAGKTTLLHVLAGAYTPTSGRISVKGQRQALLNIALGFSGDATVRENIFLRAAALGLSPGETRGLLSAILDFAELGAQANDRLYTLSAGQKLRLAFSVTTATQPDILLLDEWISAGDMVFMQKAQRRLRDIVSESKIVVLASHSAELLKSVCNVGLVIDEGRLAFFGDIGEAINEYRSMMGAGARKVISAGGAADASSMQLPAEPEPKPLAADVPDIGPLPFRYHTIAENRVFAGQVISEYRALVEILEADPVECANLLFDKCSSADYRFSGFNVISDRVGWDFEHPDGSKLRLTIAEFKGNAPRTIRTARGTCHLVWSSGVKAVPAEPADKAAGRASAQTHN